MWLFVTVSEDDAGEGAAVKRRWSTESSDSLRNVKVPKTARRQSTFEAEGRLFLLIHGILGDFDMSQTLCGEVDMSQTLCGEVDSILFERM